MYTVFPAIYTVAFLAGVKDVLIPVYTRGDVETTLFQLEVGASVEVTKDNRTSEGSDQCPHLYAAHNLATAAVAWSLSLSPSLHAFVPDRRQFLTARS